MDDFNLLFGLFETGDYFYVVQRIIEYLDLDSLYNLSLVNKSCNLHLKTYVYRKRSDLRRGWLRSHRTTKNESLVTIEGTNFLK